MILDAVTSSTWSNPVAIIGAEDLTMSEIYGKIVDRAINEATQELTSVKRAFVKRGIKVTEEHRYKDGVHADYLCRGYQGKMFLEWAVITPIVVEQMREFLAFNK
jgi:hypothetical protein